MAVLFIVLRILWRAICNLFSCLWPSRVRLPDLSADVCLVTGAGQGLGRQIALQLAADCDATVVLWDINEETLRDVEREIRDAGGNAHAYVVDCSDRKAVYSAAERVRDDVGDVAVLVNNAGVTGFSGGFVEGELTDDTIVKTFSVNTLAHFWTVRAFLPWMTENNYGYIVNVASFAAHVAAPNAVAYAASKAAARSFSESLRYELHLAGKRGINVTCVCPSFINTRMLSAAQLEAARERNEKVLEPDHVAGCILRGMAEKKTEIILPPGIKFINSLKLFIPQTMYDSILCDRYSELMKLIKKKENSDEARSDN